MLWLSPTRGTLRLTKIASDFSSFYVHRTPWAAESCHSSRACSLQRKWTEMHSLTCWLSGPYLKSAVITAFVTAGSSVEPILPSQWNALGCVQAAGLQLPAGRCPELCPVAMFAAEMPSLEGWGAQTVFPQHVRILPSPRGMELLEQPTPFPPSCSLLARYQCVAFSFCWFVWLENFHEEREWNVVLLLVVTLSEADMSLFSGLLNRVLAYLHNFVATVASEDRKMANLQLSHLTWSRLNYFHHFKGSSAPWFLPENCRIGEMCEHWCGGDNSVTKGWRL